MSIGHNKAYFDRLRSIREKYGDTSCNFNKIRERAGSLYTPGLTSNSMRQPQQLQMPSRRNNISPHLYDADLLGEQNYPRIDHLQGRINYSSLEKQTEIRGISPKLTRDYSALNTRARPSRRDLSTTPKHSEVNYSAKIRKEMDTIQNDFETRRRTLDVDRHCISRNPEEGREYLNREPLRNNENYLSLLEQKYPYLKNYKLNSQLVESKLYRPTIELDRQNLGLYTQENRRPKQDYTKLYRESSPVKRITGKTMSFGREQDILKQNYSKKPTANYERLTNQNFTTNGIYDTSNIDRIQSQINSVLGRKL